MFTASQIQQILEIRKNELRSHPVYQAYSIENNIADDYILEDFIIK